ncbi:MAG: hypothetical protein KAI28_11960 [Sphingomonadales bacterium]|nr:hypothetical protein [Sphingomonadales bacterium]
MKTFMKTILAGMFSALIITTGLTNSATAAVERLRPYIMAEKSTGDMMAKVDDVRAKLVAAGYDVAGEYSPYETSHIIIVTNDALKANAAKSDFGGYGAAIRVAITNVDGELQISYVNPTYMSHAYRMEGDLADVSANLSETLGNTGEFGSKKGLKIKKLRKYKYMFPMESFKSHNTVGKHADFAAASAAVEKALAEGVNGNAKVYRIDIPGKDQAIIGVAMSEGRAGDALVMDIIDWGNTKHSAHLPYEVLVSGGNVYAQHGRFRIAQSFPDLTMGTFSKIMSTPGAIEKNLKTIAK